MVDVALASFVLTSLTFTILSILKPDVVLSSLGCVFWIMLSWYWLMQNSATNYWGFGWIFLAPATILGIDALMRSFGSDLLEDKPNVWRE